MRLSVSIGAVPPVAFLFIFQVYSGVGRKRRLAYPPDLLFLFPFCGGCYHGTSLASIPGMWVECDVTLALPRGEKKKRSCLFVLFRPEQKYSLVSYLVILLPTASWAWEEVWSLSLIQHYNFTTRGIFSSQLLVLRAIPCDSEIFT
jgi:hypothetical protein